MKESLVYFYWLAAQIKLRHCRARTLQTHFSWWVVALRSTSSTSASQSTGTKRLEEDDLRSGGAHRGKKAAPVPANLSLILPQCHAVLLKTTCSRAHIWAPGPTARGPQRVSAVRTTCQLDPWGRPEGVRTPLRRGGDDAPLSKTNRIH